MYEIFADPYWILNFRIDFLNHFFKIISLLTSDYFYITSIAVGYWCRPKYRLFIDLGFLLPFSTLITSILQNIFRISRLSEDLYLINVHNNFGFPSSQSLISVVFWYSIFLAFKHKARYLCFIPMLLAIISTIYLGTHTIYDVFFGMICGILIIIIWNSHFIKKHIDNLYSFKYTQIIYFWSFMFIFVTIYALSSNNIHVHFVVPMSFGALAGYGFSLSSISNNLKLPDQEINLKKIISIPFFLLLLVLIAKFSPVIKYSNISFYMSVGFRYLIVVFTIYSIFPKIQYLLYEQKN